MKHHTKLLAVLPVLALGLSLTVPVRAASLDNFQPKAAYEDSFSDVAADKWYRQPVELCYEYGLMNGAGNGTFLPDSDLTVGQALAMASRVRETYTTGKSLVLQNKLGIPWWRPYVDYALGHSILTSEWDNYERPVTRAEMAFLFLNAITLDELPALNYVTRIPDVSMDDAYAFEIYHLYRAGVLTGGEGGAFRPDDPITRAEAAAILSRIALPSERKTFTLEGQTEEPITDGLWDSPSILADSDGITITAVGFNQDGMTGPAVQLMIKNSSDFPMDVMCNNLKVNGFMIRDDLHEIIPAGQEIYTIMVLNQADLDYAEITGVSLMELDFLVFLYNENGDIWRTSPVQLLTTYEGDIGGYVPEGLTLANENNVWLTAESMNAGTDFGPALIFYVENNTERRLAIHNERVLINGQRVYCALFEEVDPMKKRMLILEPSWEALGDIGVTSWEQINSANVCFTVFDVDTAETVLQVPGQDIFFE